MCNRFHQSEKAAAYAAEFHGLAIDVDVTLPPPKLFPTGKKTARHGIVVRRLSEGNRPLILSSMEWGVPTTVPGAKPGVKLEQFVTNCRNVASPFWRSMLTNPVHAAWCRSLTSPSRRACQAEG